MTVSKGMLRLLAVGKPVVSTATTVGATTTINSAIGSITGQVILLVENCTLFSSAQFSLLVESTRSHSTLIKTLFAFVLIASR
jgi:hypothetical protein